MSRKVGQLDKANPGRHSGAMTAEDLAALIAAHRAAQDAFRRATETRDAGIRRAHAGGMGVVEIARVTGYTRETIRKVLRAGEEA